jgi:hypothetical protein
VQSEPQALAPPELADLRVRLDSTTRASAEDGRPYSVPAGVYRIVEIPDCVRGDRHVIVLRSESGKVWPPLITKTRKEGRTVFGEALNVESPADWDEGKCAEADVYLDAWR